MRKHIFSVVLLSAAALMLLPPADAASVARRFNDAVKYWVGAQPQCVRTGDFDEDGNIDLVSANFGFNEVSVLLGNGNGAFGIDYPYSAGSGPYWVAVADFNEDDHQDLAVANNSSDKVTILDGAGDGTFSFGTDYDVGDAPTSVVTGDFDKDGHVDMAVTNRGSDDVTIINGAGGSGLHSVGDGPMCVAIGDFNEDGDIDLVTANKNSNDLSILLGTSGDGFNAGSTLSAGTNPYEVTTGDFDEDGHTDLAAVNAGSNNISVLLGNGNGSFAAAVNHAVSTKPYGIASGDFNGDGHWDLAAANNDSYLLSVLFGAGDATFASPVNYGTEDTPRSVATGDFDNNGYTDLATADSYGYALSVFNNRMGIDIASIADIPNDQGRQIRISWDPCFNDDSDTPLEITEYAVYRKIDYTLGSAAETVECIDDGDPKVADDDREPLRYPPGDWDYLASVPARMEGPYSVVVPTLADSTISEGMYWSVYFVSALASTPGRHVDSQPDSGYSVDNLEPGAPGAFAVAYNTGSGNDLTWEECEDEDFKYYRIYRDESEGFEPGPENLVHSTADLGWLDTVEDGWKYCYMISSVDHSGNESEPKAPDEVTGIETPAPPAAFALHQNYPNPFNPATTIDFDLPASSFVSLRIYNVNGELVRTVVENEMTAGRKSKRWNGRDADGRAVASGVYFYRINAGEFEKTRKMILMR